MTYQDLIKKLPNGWRLKKMGCRWVCRTTMNNPGKGRYTQNGDTREEALEKMYRFLVAEGLAK